jgi:hypothetical protein
VLLVDGDGGALRVMLTIRERNQISICHFEFCSLPLLVSEIAASSWSKVAGSDLGVCPFISGIGSD